jgi:hypothetical protein
MGWNWNQFYPILHTRRSSAQSDKYQVSSWYSYFPWWWKHGCPKHVESRNKHKRKTALGWFYLQDYTRMHGKQNIKFYSTLSNGNILQLLDLYLQQLHRWVGFSVEILIIFQLAEQICLLANKMNYYCGRKNSQLDIIPIQICAVKLPRCISLIRLILILTPHQLL